MRPEDRLAEQVHVEAHALAADACDRRTQAAVARVDDEVPDEVPQDAPRDRDDDAGERGREQPADADRRALPRGQEGGDLAGELVQAARGDAQVLGADHPVDEAHDERQARGVLEHARELGGRRVRGQLGGLVQPAPDEGHRLVGEVAVVVGAGAGRACGGG